ncbi:17879_t:CDS:2 [Cetraspora pellucida]|uniref:17879_t:CDS:1 n=1 Tax=Cetraspora pellucida TaxID=1433469 RepID=A0ACA9M6L3_9GLOM|nr:17879_t:CDS:2 [Cetraspora pellucida]
MAQGPMQALATQIAALVQQLQGAPPVQVNVPGTNRELSTVPYQDFYEGDQDPITWLEDIEKTFDANMVSDNRKISKKKNVEGREDTVGLGETEEIPPQDADMDNRNEIEDLDDDVQEKHIGDQRMDQPEITCYVIQKEDQRIADLFDYCYENRTPAKVEYQIGELERTSRTYHEILTHGCKPIKQRSYRNSQQKQKEYHDRRYRMETYQIGDKVLLHETSLETSYSAKLEERFTGPYYIYDVFGNGAYKLRTICASTDKPGSIEKVFKKTVHGNRLKRYISLSVKEDILHQLRRDIKDTTVVEVHITKDSISCYNKKGEAMSLDFPDKITTEPLENAKMSFYLNDLWRMDIPTQSLIGVAGETWDEQVLYLRNRIRNKKLDPSTLLQFYYFIGKRLAEKS